MSGAKWLVTHFENSAKQVIHKLGYWGIRMDGWESFTKHYPRKCPIGWIEINNEVINDWRSCVKKAPGHPVSNYSAYILTFGHLLEKFLSSHLIYQSILIIYQSISAFTSKHHDKNTEVHLIGAQVDPNTYPVKMWASTILTKQSS